MRMGYGFNESYAMLVVDMDRLVDSITASHQRIGFFQHTSTNGAHEMKISVMSGDSVPCHRVLWLEGTMHLKAITSGMALRFIGLLPVSLFHNKYTL